MGTYVRTQTIDHVIGERGILSLSVTSGDLRARATDGGEAHVSATFEIRAPSDAEADRIFDAIQLQVQRGDGALTIQERNGDSFGSIIGRLFGGSGQVDLSIEAEIPSHAQVRLEAVSADMEVNGLRGEQRYRTVSGDLMLSALGGSIRLDTVSGDATLRADEPLDLKLQGVSGDMRITAPLVKGLRANTVSGDVEIEAELGAKGDFQVETVSGDLVLGLVGSASIEVHGLSTDVHSELDHRLEGQVDRRRLIIGSGQPRLVFNSMSGDVDVRRPRRLSQQAAVATPAMSEASDSQLEILRALERGEIDVDEATRRLGEG